MNPLNFDEFFLFVERVKKRNFHSLLIVDKKVASLYEKLLHASGLHWLLIEQGERAKCREEKARIEDYLLEHGYGKDSELIAFGGGATLDLVGFVAATYMRGVSLSFIPTTIIAYVDASVGGKNGINTPHGKNLLGTFYDPIDCCLSSSFFQTLSQELYQDQFSEVVKMACLCGKDLLEGDVYKKTREAKQAIVSLDPREKGKRAILNLGHTFAHAYEKLFSYEPTHGRAVWLGLHFAAMLSYRLHLLSKEDLNWITSFCTQDLYSFDVEKLYAAMVTDKKNKEGKPHFVLLKAIGEPYQVDARWSHFVEKRVVVEVLEQMLEEKRCIVS